MSPWCPHLHPIPAMRWDLGMVAIQHQINYMKLMFLHYVIGLDQSVVFAKEIYEMQKSLNFPGLVQNHDNWSHITTYRTLLKKALELKSKFSGSKLNQGPFKDETFEIQDYIHQMNLNVMLARTLIRSPTWSGARHMPHSGRVLISTVTRMLSNISRKSSKSVRAWTQRLSDWPWLWSKQVNWLFLRGWPVERTGVTRLTGLQHIRTVWSVCVL